MAILSVSCSSTTADTDDSTTTDINWFDSSITHEEDCREDMQQFWYNDKCWNDFSLEASDGILPEDVDAVVSMFSMLEEDAYINIDDTSITTFTPSWLFDYDHDRVVIMQVFEWNGNTHSIFIQSPLESFEPYQKIPVHMALMRGNVLEIMEKEEVPDENLVSKGKGDLYGEPVELGYEDLITPNFSITGTFDNGMTYETFFNIQLASMGDTTLAIKGDRAVLSGTLGPKAYLQVQSLREHPEVKVLVLQDLQESNIEPLNMYTGRLIHSLELTTFVPYNSVIFSGGVDLFVAGKKCIVERGGKIGIHASWVDGGYLLWEENEVVSTADYPEDHPEHMFQLGYLAEVLGEEVGYDFYFRSIYATPPDDIHYMTEDEMLESQIVTKIIERGATLD